MERPDPTRPNVLTILADDLGYGDLFATCADILRIQLPDTIAPDSVSLLPLLRGDQSAPVRDDPQERHNRLGEEPERVPAMRERLAILRGAD